MATTVSDLLGKRVLLRVSPGSWSSGNVEEYKVLELSPGNNWVKLMNLNGNKSWLAVANIQYVDTLQDLYPGEDKPRPSSMPQVKVLLDWMAEKQFYTLESVKDAFFKTFMYQGEVYFGLPDLNVSDSEQTCKARVEPYWKQFLSVLVSSKE